MNSGHAPQSVLITGVAGLFCTVKYNLGLFRVHGGGLNSAEWPQSLLTTKVFSIKKKKKGTVARDESDQRILLGTPSLIMKICWWLWSH